MDEVTQKHAVEFPLTKMLSGLLCWGLVTLGVGALFLIFMDLFHLFLNFSPVGPDPELSVPWYWFSMGTTIVLGVCAVVAFGLRRWGAMAATILLAFVAAFFTFVYFDRVEEFVTPPPVEAPYVCQCRSGGDGGCPGG